MLAGLTAAALPLWPLSRRLSGAGLQLQRQSCLPLHHLSGPCSPGAWLGGDPSLTRQASRGAWDVPGAAPGQQAPGPGQDWGDDQPGAAPAAEAQQQAGQAQQRKKDLHVVLVHPQIPGNTGSIARTCAATAVWLHLVQPLGFQIDDTKLKRAGLDYWPHVVLRVHQDWGAFLDFFLQQPDPKRLVAFSKTGSVPHHELEYQGGDWLLFGAETTGLPPEAFQACREGAHAGGVARIPIDESYVRSLNLAVAAGIGVYEALRQIEGRAGAGAALER